MIIPSADGKALQLNFFEGQQKCQDLGGRIPTIQEIVNTMSPQKKVTSQLGDTPASDSSVEKEIEQMRSKNLFSIYKALPNFYQSFHVQDCYAVDFYYPASAGI